MVQIITETPKNQALTDAIEQLFHRKPGAVTHSEFNRLMFLEAMIYKTGMGCSAEQADIMDYASMNEREFNELCREYLTSKVIISERNMYGILMYKLNTDMKEMVQAELDAPKLVQAGEVKEERRKTHRRKLNRRKAY